MSPKNRDKDNKKSSWIRKIIPGIVTGASDDDPGGIATYSQVGAVSGFSLLWLLLVTTPLLFAVQEMAARVGVITKKGLSLTIRQSYGFRIAFFASMILLVCNVATIGADIAGVSAAIGLVLNMNFIWFVIPVTLFLIYILFAKNFKSLNSVLFVLSFVIIAYVVSGIVVHPEWGSIAQSIFYPDFASYKYMYFILAVGLLGTTISPYLIFWQTTEEVEEHTTVRDYKEGSKGVMIGMIYSNLIAFFIIIASAIAIKDGGEYIVTAADAAVALRPVAGNLAYILFAVGIFAGGILAVPVLAASSAYSLSEVLGWKCGLNCKFKQATGFYMIILFSLLAGGLIALFGIKPMLLLLYTQVLNGILMPILLLILLMVMNNRSIMGNHVNKLWSNILGVIALLLFVGFDMVMIWEWIIK